MRHARSRGQILVLGCLAMLMLATMVMISFNVTNAVHEKIRLQSHADAQAFSVATLQARAFNQMAYSNRAIAAAVVAQMAVHSWVAIASEEISILKAGKTAFIWVAVMEFAQCPKFKIQHCMHGFKAMRISKKYGDKASDYADELEGKESDFNDAIDGLTSMINSINRDQKSILAGTMKEVSTSGEVLGKLLSTNAPKASYKSAIHGLNGRELACTVEGSNFDGQCTAMIGKQARSKADAAVRSKVMESAANAVRQKFEHGKTTAPAIASMDWMPPMFNPQISQDIQEEGQFIFTKYKVTSRVGDTSYDADAQNDEESKNVGATASKGQLFVQWKDGVGFGSFSAKVFSDSGGGTHEPSDGHTGQHDKFKGFWQEDPCSDSSCFVNFRASSSADDDFGQPSGYGAVGQDLRLSRDGKKSPSEINEKGVIRVKLTPDKYTEVNIVPRSEAVAVGKAKAYFHQPGDWQVAPNFFDPFWRAKLHPFARKELKEVLTLAGDMKGATIVEQGGPVEGDTR